MWRSLDSWLGLDIHSDLPCCFPLLCLSHPFNHAFLASFWLTRGLFLSACQLFTLSSRFHNSFTLPHMLTSPFFTSFCFPLHILFPSHTLSSPLKQFFFPAFVLPAPLPPHCHFVSMLYNLKHDPASPSFPFYFVLPLDSTWPSKVSLGTRLPPTPNTPRCLHSLSTWPPRYLPPLGTCLLSFLASHIILYPRYLVLLGTLPHLCLPPFTQFTPVTGLAVFTKSAVQVSVMRV